MAARLAGRVAFVSGGASGLGFGTVERFVAQGAKVLFVDLQAKADQGKQLADRLGAENATFLVADVTSEEEVKNALQETKERYGKLDVLVGCAGIGVSILTYNPKKDHPEARYHSLDLFRTVLNTNLLGTYNVARQCVALMKENEPDANGDRGVIVNVSSVSSFEGQRGQTAYATSTGGVNGMTLPLSADLAESNIRVNVIAPGYFDTPILGNIPHKVKTFLESTVPNPPRLGKADEFAHLAQAIVENPYINGEIIRIDGAIRLHP